MPADPLARDPRIHLAEERTLLAWVRTGLALMGFGFVVARFGMLLRELAAASRAGAVDGGGETHPAGGASVWIGAVLVVLGVLVNLIAAAQHVRRTRRLAAGEVLLPAPGFGVAVSLVLAAVGAGMAWYLLRLPGP
jgi:putative membrane protein